MAGAEKKDDWHCGGWPGAEREQLRRMASLSFEEKIQWLEEAQKMADHIKAWRRSQGLPTIVQTAGSSGSRSPPAC